MSETYEPPSQERLREFEEIGLTLDELGRPLHPWLETHDIDLPDETTLWRWGPNTAADAIVLNADRPEVLLIQRADGTWANAGGFVDASDPHAAAAAAREAGEEAGIKLDLADALPVHNGIVHDKRASKYSWVTTATFLWRRSIQLDMLTAADDAQDIRLASLAEVRHEQLYGSHNDLIAHAIEKHGTLHEKLHFYREDLERLPIDGGHMEYDKYIAALPSGERLFIKRHLPDTSTDSNRSERLLKYLEKEHAAYQLLKTHDYLRIPDQFEYKNGALLMSTLDEKDGWTWQVPDSEHASYIETTLAAIRDLETIPLGDIGPDIAPSHLSYIEEGWDKYDSGSHEQMVDHLRIHASKVDDEVFSKDALVLADELRSLYKISTEISLDDHMVTCHHDFRPSNFAYHPEHGVRIVDWSWAGPGMKGSDATTFLIDLYKQGIDVSDYMDNFNKDHALIMIGFWLMRGISPVHKNADVRFQQIHTAVAAHSLLKLGTGD